MLIKRTTCKPNLKTVEPNDLCKKESFCKKKLKQQLLKVNLLSALIITLHVSSSVSCFITMIKIRLTSKLLWNTKVQKSSCSIITQNDNKTGLNRSCLKNVILLLKLSNLKCQLSFDFIFYLYSYICRSSTVLQTFCLLGATFKVSNLKSEII